MVDCFAGFSTLEGKDFHFDYETFQVKMDSVRFFDLFVPTGEVDKAQNPVALSIASRIEHFDGVLLIDAPHNKSGKENIPMFPSLQTKSNSFVYYDRDSTQNRAYPRDSFYFELKPFSFNHLDMFNGDDLNFKGELILGGRFSRSLKKHWSCATISPLAFYQKRQKTEIRFTKIKEVTKVRLT